MANTITFNNFFTIGILMAKIEYWTKQYDFSFQFWTEEAYVVYISKSTIDVSSFDERSIPKLLEKTISWCEKANPRFKYPQNVVNTEIDLHD